MCTVYQANYSNHKALKEKYELSELPEDKLTTRYRIGIGTEAPVITEEEPDVLTFMKWGIPASFGSFLFSNVRDDTMKKGGHWADKIIGSNRILIPVTGFYEAKGARGKKDRPLFYFKSKNEEFFSMGGFYKEVKIGDVVKKLYTLITTDPIIKVGSEFPRMPFVLTKEQEKDWLNPDIAEKEEIMKLVKPYHGNDLEYWQVSRDIYKRIPESPDFIKPLN